MTIQRPEDAQESELWEQQKRTRPAPDVSWVTTEPVYEGPAWLLWTKLVATILCLAMWAADAVAVILK